MMVSRCQAEFCVGVIVPAYNAADTLARTLDSLADQTRPPDEIVVVDDGSADNTARIAREHRVGATLVQQANAGLPAARNAGIKACRGDWIAFLDADDEWLPHKLERQLDHLAQHPDLVWTTANFYRCTGPDDTGQPDTDPDHARRLVKDREVFDSYFQAYLAHAHGWVGTMLIRRDVLEEAGLFNAQQRVIEDMDLWFRIAYHYPRIGFLAEPLARYYVDTPGSLLKSPIEVTYVYELIDRHLALARTHGRLEEFRPCAARMLGYRIQRLLQEGRGRDVRQLLGRYHDLFGPYMRTTTWLASLLPRTAARYEQCKNHFRK